MRADGDARDPADGAAAGSWRVGLAALTVLLGMQSLRALLPLLTFIFRDRFGWHSALVGALAFAVFATGFLAAPLRRRLGGRRFLLLTVGGVGLMRLELQLWAGEPLVDFGLALAATVFFLLAVPALPADRAPGAPHSPALGWMLGLAAETTFHVAYGTWDMSWRSDAATLGIVFLLVLAQWWLLAAVSKDVGERVAAGQASTPSPSAWAWLGAGPFLFLELIVLGNVARLAALTSWPVEVAATWAVAGRLLAVAAAVLVVGRPPSRRAAAAAGAVLVGALAIPWPTGILAASLWLSSAVAASALLATILSALGSRLFSGPNRLGAAYGLGLLASAALFFLYYGGIDLRLGVAKEMLPPVAALGLGLAAAGAALHALRRPAAGRIGRACLAAGLLLAVPLIRLVTAPEVRASGAGGFPLRVLTYNVHCGIDPRGHLGLEAIAAAIEAEEPDVVALQEVSRGWVIAGSVDAAAWLSHRLGMPFVFAPTADPLWGNAVLSRRPIADREAVDLPDEDLLIRRGFVAAWLDLGDAGHLEVIATHFHHRRGGGSVRERQSRALLDFWRGRGRTVILGDLNARPGEPEIEALRRAGLADVLDLAGVEPGYTHSSFAPVKRIDYVWISPDLVVREASVPRVTASDHLPVSATLEVREIRDIR